MKSYTYILKCCDKTYYTGSTHDIKFRITQHKNGEGARYTRERLPVMLVYVEEYDNIQDAFNREKQVQKWSKKKKEALIQKRWDDLERYSKAKDKKWHSED